MTDDNTLIDRLISLPYKYIPNDVFDKPSAVKELFTEPDPVLPNTEWYNKIGTGFPVRKSPRPPVMNAHETKLMFLRFNFCRRMFMEAREKLCHQKVRTKRSEQELLHWYRRASFYREYITGKNLGLVLRMLKFAVNLGNDWAEIRSRCAVKLLDSIDGFDVGRGFRFSTYACRAMLREFSRMHAALYRGTHKLKMNSVLYRADIDQTRLRNVRYEGRNNDLCLEVKRVLENNTAGLSKIELAIISLRTQEGHLTLAEVGKLFGVTRERIRQIETRAHNNLREVLSQSL